MRTPDSPENYNAFKDSQRQQEQTRKLFQVATRLERTGGSNPSSEQLAAWVASQTGRHSVSEDLARDNYDLFREAEGRAWAEKLGKKAPILLASLADPKNGGITRAEAEALAGIEQTLSSVNGAPGAVDGERAEGAVQLTSVPTPLPRPYKRVVLPPFPVPDPRHVGPRAGPEPRDTLPLPDPRKSPAIPTQSEAQENATAPVVDAPADASSDRDAVGAHSSEVGGTSAAAGPTSKQLDTSSGVVVAPELVSSQPEEETPPPAGGEAVTTTPAEPVKPSADASGVPGAPPSQALPERDEGEDAGGFLDWTKPYGNAFGRWYFKFERSSALAGAEDAIRISQDEKKSLKEISESQWDRALGGSREGAFKILFDGGRDSFIRSMEERHNKLMMMNRSLDIGNSFSYTQNKFDLMRPGFPPDPAIVYTGLAIFNDYNTAKRFLKARISTIFGVNQKEEARKDLQRVNELNQLIAASPMSEAAIRFENALKQTGEEPTISGQLSRVRTVISSDLPGLVAYMTEVGAESVPDLLISALATAATGNPVVGIAVSAGLTYRQERAEGALSVLAEKGITLSSAGDVESLLNNEEVWAEMERRGVARALLLTLADISSGGLAEAKFFGSPIIDAVVQRLGAPAALVAGDVLEKTYSGEEVTVANIALSAAVAVSKTTAAKLVDSGLEKLSVHIEKASIGEAKYKRLLSLSRKIRESLLSDPDPERIHVNLLNEFRGNPDEFIYIRASDILRLRDKGESSLEILFDHTRGISENSFSDALAADGYVYMPTATYLTYFEPKIGAELSPYVHLGDPDIWDAGETQAFYDVLKENSGGANGENAKGGLSAPEKQAPGESVAAASDAQEAPSQNQAFTTDGREKPRKKSSEEKREERKRRERQKKKEAQNELEETQRVEGAVISQENTENRNSILKQKRAEAEERQRAFWEAQRALSEGPKPSTDKDTLMRSVSPWSPF